MGFNRLQRNPGNTLKSFHKFKCNTNSDLNIATLLYFKFED